MTITISPLALFVVAVVVLAVVALRAIRHGIDSNERMNSADNAHHERQNDSYQAHAERMELLRNPQNIYLFAEPERELIRREMARGLTLFDAVAQLHAERRIELPHTPSEGRSLPEARR